MDGISDGGVCTGVQELPKRTLSILRDGGHSEFTGSGISGCKKASLPQAMSANGCLYFF